MWLNYDHKTQLGYLSETVHTEKLQKTLCELPVFDIFVH